MGAKLFVSSKCVPGKFERFKSVILFVLVFLAKLVRPESQSLVLFVTVVRLAHILCFWGETCAPCVPNSSFLKKCVQGGAPNPNISTEICASQIPNARFSQGCALWVSQSFCVSGKLVHLVSQILVLSRNLCALSQIFSFWETCSPETQVSAIGDWMHWENSCTWAPNPDILVTLAAGAALITKKILTA